MQQGFEVHARKKITKFVPFLLRSFQTYSNGQTIAVNSVASLRLFLSGSSYTVDPLVDTTPRFSNRSGKNLRNPTDSGYFPANLDSMPDIFNVFDFRQTKIQSICLSIALTQVRLPWNGSMRWFIEYFIYTCSFQQVSIHPMNYFVTYVPASCQIFSSKRKMSIHYPVFFFASRSKRSGKWF